MIKKSGLVGSGVMLMLENQEAESQCGELLMKLLSDLQKYFGLQTVFYYWDA